MKKFFLYVNQSKHALLLALVLFISTNLFSQRILVVGHYQVEKIDAIGVAEDSARIRRLIGSSTEVKYVVKIENSSFSLTNIDFSSYSTVLYYYSGHGFNDSNSDYPSTAVSKLSQGTIVKLLIDSNVSNFLVFYDCCNKSKQSEEYQNLSAPCPIEFLQNLKGRFAIWAAKKGEYSWGGKRTGGLFSSIFFNNISGNNCNKNVDVIFNLANTEFLSRYSTIDQHPQFKKL